MAAKYPKKVDKNILQVGELSFRVRLMHSGHQIDKTLDSLAEAQTYRDLVKANAALDENESRIFESRAKKAEVKAFTFTQAIKKYRTEKSEKKKGWESEECRLDKIDRWPDAGMPLYQIKSDHVLKLLEWIKTSGRATPPLKEEVSDRGQRKRNQAARQGTEAKAASEATVKRYYNLVHHIFQIAVDEWRKIESNPCGSIPKSARPKDGKGRDRRLRGDEYQQMFCRLDGQARLFFVLAVETAMRSGEIIGMRWEHLDLKSRVLRIPETKTDEKRTIYLSDVVITAIEAIKPRGIKGRILSISASQIRYQWRVARKSIGSPDLRIHDLRHEATSRLFEKGFGDIEAATQTGHKSLQMLKRYAHLKQSHILEKLNRPLENRENAKT